MINRNNLQTIETVVSQNRGDDSNYEDVYSHYLSILVCSASRMGAFQWGPNGVLLFFVICVFSVVSIYTHQLVSIHLSGAVEVIRRPFDSYVHFALVQKDQQIIPYDTCARCGGK